MAFVTPVMKQWLEREIARSDDPSHHEQTLLPRSYISLLPLNEDTNQTTKILTFEWMSDCLTTPHLKMKIGYWVSDKWFIKDNYIYIKI